MKTQTNIISALLRRLADKKAGKATAAQVLTLAKWGGTPFRLGENVGYRNTWGRWHESPESAFRFAGLASAIVNLGHNGWYTRYDEYDPDELARGAVYMLPHGRYMAAIADPCQSDKDGSGPCIVEVDERGNPCMYEDKDEAARSADQFAEKYAESSREDDRHERGKQTLRDIVDADTAELAGLRSDARGLLQGIRDSRLSPGLCSRLTAELRAMRLRMHRAFHGIRNAEKELAAMA